MDHGACCLFNLISLAQKHIRNHNIYKVDSPIRASFRGYMLNINWPNNTLDYDTKIYNTSVGDWLVILFQVEDGRVHYIIIWRICFTVVLDLYCSFVGTCCLLWMGFTLFCLSINFKEIQNKRFRLGSEFELGCMDFVNEG